VLAAVASIAEDQGLELTPARGQGSLRVQLHVTAPLHLPLACLLVDLHRTALLTPEAEPG
jgi:hypothetical protein